MIEIYHWSSVEIEIPKLILESKFNKDFGDGFYFSNPDCIFESYKAGEMLE